MDVLRVFRQEFWVHFKNPIQAETLDTHECFWIYNTFLRMNNLDAGVDLMDFFCDEGNFLLGHEVNLVEENAVSKRDLLHALVLSTLRFFFLEMLDNVLRI